mmetsp:Transcript_10074/g.61237  ORF Transcript_10074/g.61237 Transcript_10074/m.61237 type:complete len:166 (-) Transcript_10074:28-525(-)
MLHEHQRTLAPSAVRVSINTAVWMVMWRDPVMLQPLKGCAGPNSSRHAMSPGISTCVIKQHRGARTSDGQPIILSFPFGALPSTLRPRRGLEWWDAAGRVQVHGSVSTFDQMQREHPEGASVESMAYLREFDVQTTEVGQGEVFDLVFPSGLVLFDGHVGGHVAS